VIELYLYKKIGIKMQSLTSLQRLSEKISQIVKNQDSLKSENEVIRNELVTLKAEKEIKDQEIEKLIEQNAKKDLEIEEIVSKIESILG
jgi:chromosome segregation ATPase